MGGELLAQGGTVDAEGDGGAALVAFVESEHFTQQGAFDFTDHQGMETFAAFRIANIRQVTTDGAADAFAEGTLHGGLVGGLTGSQSHSVQGIPLSQAGTQVPGQFF